MSKVKRAFVFFKAVVKNNAVCFIALSLALISSFIVPPDREYIDYFDFKTLSCLFCVLAVVCALRNVRFFYVLASKIVRVFKTARMSVLALVYVTFIGSMLIANDMALLTFLPLGFYVLHTTDKEKYMAFTYIMQNIAANLGGMLTPFGNPQNLYLYTRFNIPDGEFVIIMLPLFLLSVSIITVCCIIFVKNEPLAVEPIGYNLPKGRVAIYLVLFALSILIVFRFIPYAVGLITVPLVLLFMDRRALLNVDYGLLFTFVFFFILSGNLARVDIIREFFQGLLDTSVLVVSTLLCQFISNVPSAILLSQFTDNYRELLMGVNIGGVGTIIASLASLITFREYTLHKPKEVGRYLLKFTAFNFTFLIILLGFAFVCL